MAQAADGALDPTFGREGRVKTDFHRSNDLAHGMALQPDGKIVVAVSASSESARPAVILPWHDTTQMALLTPASE